MAKPLIVVFILFSFIALSANGQPVIPKDVNQLYHLLAQSKADTGRVNLLIKIGRYDYANAAQKPALLDSALSIEGRAKTLAETLNYPEGAGLSYQAMAQAWCNKKDFKKSDALIKKSIGIFLEHNLYRDAAEAYLNVEQFYLAADGKDFRVRIKYYELAQPLFHKAGAYDREGATLTLLGDFYQMIDEPDKSLELLNRALTIYQKIKYPYVQYLYDLLGTVNLRKNRFNEALRYGLMAEKTAIELKDTSLMLCTIYNRLGVTSALIDKTAQSEFYLKKSLVLAEKYNDLNTVRIVSRNLIDVLANANNYPEAFKLLKDIRKKFPHPDSGMIRYDYGTYVGLYTCAKNYPMAQRYVDSLLKTSVLSRGSASTTHALDAMTTFFIDSKQYDQAAKYLPAYLQVALKLSQKRDEYRAYLRSFKADSARKDYLSAINNYNRYFTLKDSLYNVAKIGQLEEIKIKYETEQKEQSIKALQSNSILQEESLRRADNIRNVTIISSLILLILIVLLYKSYRVNKQNTEAINRKNDALNQLVTEKEWLLKEIHHRVKNNLQIVTGLLQRQSAYIDNNEALAAIQNSENRMNAIALIHQKLYQSESLDLISMPEYIEEMVNYLKDSCGLDNRIIFEKHFDEIRLDVVQAVPLGLILNEAITNAIKYAYKPNESGIIYITLVKNEANYSQLTIADNGPGLPEGFDLDKVDSLGFNLMRGLCKQLGGVLEFSSEQGFTINITFKTEVLAKL